PERSTTLASAGCALEMSTMGSAEVINAKIARRRSATPVSCGVMPRRETKRGADRTPLEGRWDVVICGASFAGLAVARELQGSGARTLLLDRYEIGERQTSACGIPTMWL